MVIKPRVDGRKLISKTKFQYWFYSSWFNIASRYRKTFLGPIWIIASPVMFISMLGLLYATIANVPLEIFIPHMAVGVVVWSFITQLMNSGVDVVYHNRPKILNSGSSLNDLVAINLIISFLQFLHVITVIVGVWLIFRWELNIYAFTSLIGVGFIILNGYWYTIVFGVLGTRFRDISQIIVALTGALFFVTPIIWMPTNDGRGGILGPYLTYNPFHHFLELVRAPILGNPIDPLSWLVVISITVIGFIFAFIFYVKFSKVLVTWI